jgi:outer membrane protein assembly factor BamB
LYKNRLYFTGCYGELGCLDAETGKKIWYKNLEKDFNIKITSFGYACTPLLYNDKIFLTLGEDGGSVMALRAADGAMIWKTGTEPASYSSPIIIDIDSRKQLICFLANILVAYDPETGKELWRQEISEGYDEHAAWPVFESPYLFCASPFFRDAHMLKLSYDKKIAKIKEKWKNTAISNDIFSSVIVKGYIYGFDIEDAQINSNGKTDGRFKCIELKTGKEMWSTDATNHVSLLAVNDKLILFSDTGTLIIAKASNKKYEEITRQEIIKEEKCWTMPAILAGKLFLRGGKNIVCIDLNKHATSSDKKLPALKTYTVMEKIDNWLHQYNDIVYIAPTYRHMLLWYIYSIAIIILSAILLSATLQLQYSLKNKNLLLWVKEKQFFILFLILFLLGAAGSILFSPIAGEFIFTLPVSLFAMQLAILKMNKVSSRFTDQLYSRIMLILFIFFCFCFYSLCKSLFILSGIGFLVGLIPLLPFALLFSKYSDNKLTLKEYIKIIALFSLFFWSSAIFIVWKTH